MYTLLNSIVMRPGICLKGGGGISRGGRGRSVQVTRENLSRLANFLGYREDLIVGSQKTTEFTEMQIKQLNCNNFSEYMKRLKTSNKELQKLLEKIVVNVTGFFWIPRQYMLFRDLLGEIEKWRENERSLRIWSAGCATGEEPYSIAMILLGDKRFKDWDIKIIATDVVERFIEIAKKGRYELSAYEGIRDDEFKKLFNKFTIREKDAFIISDEIKDLVAFESHNLMEDFKIEELEDGAHIIFCRNVIIYLDEKNQIDVLRKLYKFLPSGGYLFLGLESIVGFRDEIISKFKVRKGRDSFCYQKP